MGNPWTRFQRMSRPRRPMTIGTVEEVHGDGSMTVELLDGRKARAWGGDTGVGPGDKVWVEGDRIVSGAPDQPIYKEDV